MLRPDCNLQQWQTTDFNYLPPPLCFHPAPAFSPSPRPVLLSRRRAHGDRQGALRQVRAGAVATHAVHLGKEVAAHLLAGTAPTRTPIVTIKSKENHAISKPRFLRRRRPFPDFFFFFFFLTGVCLQQCQVQRSRSAVWLPQGQHGSQLRQPVCHALQLSRTAATSGWDSEHWVAPSCGEKKRSSRDTLIQKTHVLQQENMSVCLLNLDLLNLFLFFHIWKCLLFRRFVQFTARWFSISCGH